MDFFIHSKGIQISDSLREEVQVRLNQALHRFSDKVARVHITLENVNGPRGGRDKRCVITTTLSHSGQPIVSSARHTKLDAAVGLAARRLNRALADRSDKFATRNNHVAFSPLAD